MKVLKKLGAVSAFALALTGLTAQSALLTLIAIFTGALLTLL